jgi:hypothetical protein
MFGSGYVKKLQTVWTEDREWRLATNERVDERVVREMVA